MDPQHGSPPPSYAQAVADTDDVIPESKKTASPGDLVVSRKEAGQVVVATPYMYYEKVAPSFKPYQEYCPRCRCTVVTVVEYEMGCFAWLIIILIIFVAFFLIYILCCIDIRDAIHHCPNCGMVLSRKKRG
ncbi:LITAF domain-containing protein [Caenorhabditis elegans]|uniref:LITAF domain-containing protein n=1 Tax=Caenorhabditis elegans TaxID=6239 RepID=Q9XWU7_CAEEL|nr:LITAF domain-containing protein [Caenorhabditis elegans]CAA21544.2 LITAF domain-containing protein [Caenorhabditis elegans]|eukprot:NP_001317723.1 Uncharacterized protein CELE_Y37D8A.8 [Caenorhabditis elegans]